MTASGHLLAPDDHTLMLVGHESLRGFVVASHPLEPVIDAVTGLARTARLFEVRGTGPAATPALGSSTSPAPWAAPTAWARSTSTGCSNGTAPKADAGRGGRLPAVGPGRRTVHFRRKTRTLPGLSSTVAWAPLRSPTSPSEPVATSTDSPSGLPALRRPRLRLPSHDPAGRLGLRGRWRELVQGVERGVRLQFALPHRRQPFLVFLRASDDRRPVLRVQCLKEPFDRVRWHAVLLVVVECHLRFNMAADAPADTTHAPPPLRWTRSFLPMRPARASRTEAGAGIWRPDVRPSEATEMGVYPGIPPLDSPRERPDTEDRDAAARSRIAGAQPRAVLRRLRPTGENPQAAGLGSPHRRVLDPGPRRRGRGSSGSGSGECPGGAVRLPADLPRRTGPCYLSRRAAFTWWRWITRSCDSASRICGASAIPG